MHIAADDRSSSFPRISRDHHRFQCTGSRADIDDQVGRLALRDRERQIRAVHGAGDSERVGADVVARDRFARSDGEDEGGCAFKGEVTIAVTAAIEGRHRNRRTVRLESVGAAGAIIGSRGVREQVGGGGMGPGNSKDTGSENGEIDDSFRERDEGAMQRISHVQVSASRMPMRH